MAVCRRAGSQVPTAVRRLVQWVQEVVRTAATRMAIRSSSRKAMVSGAVCLRWAVMAAVVAVQAACRHTTAVHRVRTASCRHRVGGIQAWDRHLMAAAVVVASHRTTTGVDRHLATGAAEVHQAVDGWAATTLEAVVADAVVVVEVAAAVAVAVDRVTLTTAAVESQTTATDVAAITAILGRPEMLAALRVTDRARDRVDVETATALGTAHEAQAVATAREMARAAATRTAIVAGVTEMTETEAIVTEVTEATVTEVTETEAADAHRPTAVAAVAAIVEVVTATAVTAVIATEGATATEVATEAAARAPTTATRASAVTATRAAAAVATDTSDDTSDSTRRQSLSLTAR